MPFSEVGNKSLSKIQDYYDPLRHVPTSLLYNAQSKACSQKLKIRDTKVSVRVLNVTSVTSTSADRAWKMGTEKYEGKLYILLWCSWKQLWGRMVSMVTGVEHTASRMWLAAELLSKSLAYRLVPYCLFRHSTQLGSWPVFLIHYRQWLLHMQLYVVSSRW